MTAQLYPKPPFALLFLPFAIVVGCGDEGTNPDPAFGVRVSVDVTGDTLDVSYVVIVDSSDTISLAAGDTITIASDGPGTISIELADVERNCSVTGANPGEVEVRDGTRVAFFDVTCRPALINKIVFVGRFDIDTTSIDIYSMHPDGTSIALILDTPYKDAGPALSPDGTQIAFGRGSDIYVVRSDGEGLQTNITNHPALDIQPAWSPDGSRIAFVSSRSAGGSWDIYSMRPDGSDVRRLTTDNALDLSPAWSPDGEKIVFVSQRDGDDEIYVMNSDGTDQTRLTMSTSGDFLPAWSPDGSQIAFITNRYGPFFEVAIMNQTGSAVSRLTDDSRTKRSPKWSPDGEKITFELETNNRSESDIAVISADGSGLTNLTAAEMMVGAFSPDWK